MGSPSRTTSRSCSKSCRANFVKHNVAEQLPPKSFCWPISGHLLRAGRPTSADFASRSAKAATVSTKAGRTWSEFISGHIRPTSVEIGAMISNLASNLTEIGRPMRL